MRAYHRVDPLMDERRSHYSPAQLGAYLKVQLVAGRQKQRGRFKSMRALTGALPAPYARLVPFLVAQGDLAVEEDGTVRVDGWDEWQEGDLTVRDRMARLRNRDRNRSVTSTVTETGKSYVQSLDSPSPLAPPSHSPPLPPDPSSSVSVGVGGAIRADPPPADQPADQPADCLDAYYRLTGSWPGTRALSWLNELAADHGEASVSEALAEEWQQDDSMATLLTRTKTRLGKAEHEAKRKRQAAERRQAEEERKRLEAMTPEQRASNMARLRDMMRANGLA